MPKLIITISGLTGAGKTTLGKVVAKRLNIRHIWKTHKVFSGKRKVVEFTKNLPVSFEKNFDNNTMMEAEKQDCVVTTWLGPWLIKNPTVRVLVYADLDSRINRKEREMGISAREAKRYVVEKDKLNKIRFKSIYGIDLDDHSGFDLLLNTSKLNTNQCADIVIFLTQEKAKKIFK